jgi:L-ascorbate metabolism protein UlaG (beta-lactamase superfamily)
MKIRRLGWAGIEVSAQGESLVVDYVRDPALLKSSLPEGALTVQDPPTNVLAALVTHLHPDHSDGAAITAALSPVGVVLRPTPFVGSTEEAIWTAEQEAALDTSRFDVRVVNEWDHVQLGPFSVTAVPAVDGLGDPQVNWVIEANQQRIFHGGDTMFHGYWWLIARRTGPIDVAVLPINGAVVDFPHLQPSSPLPAVLTPEQAAQTAAILKATTLLPMHYGIDQPPFYTEEDHALARLKTAAEPLGIQVQALYPGQTLTASDRHAPL